LGGKGKVVEEKGILKEKKVGGVLKGVKNGELEKTKESMQDEREKEVI